MKTERENMQSKLCITFLVGAVALLPIMALAQPTPTRAQYPEARKLYNEFDRTVSRSMMWEKKSQADRIAAYKQAIVLKERMSQIMGDSSQCGYAASTHVEFVSNMNALISASEGVGKLTPFQMLGAMNNAHAFGKFRAACYDEVEALDTVTKK